MDSVQKRFQVYKKSCFEYGFLALCYLIDKFAETEDYEECGLIKSVIEEINKELKSDMPSSYDEEAFKYYQTSYTILGNKSVETIKEESERHSNKILERIKRIK